MNKRIKTGLLLGAVVGMIDVIPMVMQKLSWDANLSAFTMWVVIGILMSVTEIKLPVVVKSLLISFLVLLPSAIIIGARGPMSLLPITIMTILLGSLLGFLFNKIVH